MAAADLYPRLTFVGSVGVEGTSPGDATRSGGGVWGFGPRLSWAGLDLWRVRARVRAAEAGLDAQYARYEQAVLAALQDAETAFVRHEKERQALARLEAASAASREAADLARVRFRAGGADLLTVLDAERRVLEYETEAARGQAVTATALIAVYKALGGDIDRPSSEGMNGKHPLASPVSALAPGL